jgi:hypothetical protein
MEWYGAKSLLYRTEMKVLYPLPGTNLTCQAMSLRAYDYFSLSAGSQASIRESSRPNQKNEEPRVSFSNCFERQQEDFHHHSPPITLCIFASCFGVLLPRFYLYLHVCPQEAREDQYSVWSKLILFLSSDPLTYSFKEAGALLQRLPTTNKQMSKRKEQDKYCTNMKSSFVVLLSYSSTLERFFFPTLSHCALPATCTKKMVTLNLEYF